MVNMILKKAYWIVSNTMCGTYGDDVLELKCLPKCYALKNGDIPGILCLKMFNRCNAENSFAGTYAIGSSVLMTRQCPLNKDACSRDIEKQYLDDHHYFLNSEEDYKQKYSRYYFVNT